MRYAEYNFYQGTYCGDRITGEEAFNRLATRASEKLDCYTMGRIDQTDFDGESYAAAVRLAVCSMADIMYLVEKRKSSHDGREIASESNDGYSVSFASASEADRESLTEKSLYQAAYVYLSQTGLMDFGVDT